MTRASIRTPGKRFRDTVGQVRRHARRIQYMIGNLAGIQCLPRHINISIAQTNAACGGPVPV